MGREAAIRAELRGIIDAALRGELTEEQATRAVTLGEHGAAAGELAVLSRAGGGAAVESDAGADLLVLAGEPIDEPVVTYGRVALLSHRRLSQTAGATTRRNSLLSYFYPLSAAQ